VHAKMMYQNSQWPAVKRCAAPRRLLCEIQGGSQEMVANGKNFNDDNSGNFSTFPPNSPEFLLLKFCH